MNPGDLNALPPVPETGDLTRREFLLRTLAGTALAAATLAEPAAWGAGPSSILAPLPGGRLTRVVPFANEGSQIMDQPIGSGLDGRLFTDLSTLTPETMVTSTSRFYIRTRTPDLMDRTRPWSIKIGGLVDRPSTAKPERLDAERRPMGKHVMECSGNFVGAHFGMLSCATWEGVPLMQLVDAARPTKKATRVLVSGFDEHSQPSGNSAAGASWVFTIEQVRAAGGFLATRMNGNPLTSDHGAPVRLMMPGWYGCTCIKWVNEIKLVDDSEPATSQMLEFARRTHQDGVPKMARDYIAATMDLAAMPIRIEQWSVGNGLVYRVVGIQWGAGVPTDKLVIRFAPRDPFVPVDRCPTAPARQGWMLWSHLWRPRVAGLHAIQLRVNDSGIRTRRLDTGFYTRLVEVGV